ncbi:MAG TPA: NAD-dependent epimerase/dehydratase family protein [Saprospiraceae bacterium]|nr:NAD-dependent epimerase/dehydratase family protein [Saprospiraceae bacterium]HMP15292.1 NAD-dependent epimerase/dehydratase family protein [Saprospiraceae bacterium]
MNHSKNKQILVTGGTGFLGSYLLRYLLREGYTQVRALRRSNSRMDLVADIADQIAWVEGDLLDIFALEKAMQNVQQLYHCAAIVSFDPRDRNQMRQVNVEGTANVVNAALHAGIAKMVHVSSVAAIGRRKNTDIVTEQSRWERSNYNSEYAISKYLSENEVWRGMVEGLPVAVVNPSIIIGSGRWHEGPQQLFRLVWNNFPFYTTGVSGFVDVRDVARFMIQLMESNITNERYILNTENLRFQTVMNEIAAHLQRKPPRIRVTPLIQQIAWRVEWLRTLLSGRRPLITREVANHATRSFYYQNGKSLTDFPNFEYTPIQQTIAETCSQFRQAAEADFNTTTLPLL